MWGKLFPMITTSYLSIFAIVFIVSAVLFTPPIFLWYVIMRDDTVNKSWEKTWALHLRNFHRFKSAAIWIPSMIWKFLKWIPYIGMVFIFIELIVVSTPFIIAVCRESYAKNKTIT